MKKASVIVGMALCFFGQVQAQNDDFGDDFKEDFESFRRAIHKDFNLSLIHISEPTRP